MIAFPSVPSGEDVVVSATMFTTFRRCPDQALARLHGEYPPDTRVSFKGNLAHRMFARHLSTGEVEASGFDQACKQEIGSGLNMKVASVGLKPSTLAGVIAEVGELYQRFKRLPHEGFRAAEVFIEAEASPGLVLRGSIDAVFDDRQVGVRLIDWKTGALGQAQDQLAFYALLWALEHDALPGRVEAVSVSTGERYAETPTDTDVARTAEAVAAMVAALRHAYARQGRLERRAGGWCRWCPILDDCDEGRSAAAVFES